MALVDFRRQGLLHYLGILVVIEDLPDEGVKGIPVVLGDVATNRPEVAEDEGGADEGVEFGLVHVQVWASLRHKQHLEQLTERRHLTDIHLPGGEGKIGVTMVIVMVTDYTMGRNRVPTDCKRKLHDFFMTVSRFSMTISLF